MAARLLRVTRLRGLGNAPTVDYGAALRLQEALRTQRLGGADGGAAGAGAGAGDSLLLLQHSPVYTLGRRTAAESQRLANAPDGPQQHEHLLFDDAFLAESGATVFDTKRGGQVTFHGKGQLVGYPVLHLRQLARHDRTLTPRGYIPALEGVLADTLKTFGVEAVGRSDEGSDLAGVWIGGSKVAAIGVHVSRGVTTHGFALNVTDEPLPFFERIVPCGLSQPVTCVAHHMPQDSCHGGEELIANVEAEFVRQFVRRFGYGDGDGQVHDAGRVPVDELLDGLVVDDGSY